MACDYFLHVSRTYPCLCRSTLLSINNFNPSPLYVFVIQGLPDFSPLPGENPAPGACNVLYSPLLSILHTR